MNTGDRGDPTSMRNMDGDTEGKRVKEQKAQGEHKLSYDVTKLTKVNRAQNRQLQDRTGRRRKGNSTGEYHHTQQTRVVTTQSQGGQDGNMARIGKSTLNMSSSSSLYVSGIPLSLGTINPQMSMTPLQIAEVVMQDGRPNVLGCRIPLKSNWNFQLLDSLCESRYDCEIVQFLRYGWPLNREVAPVAKTYGNHASAERYKAQVTKYVLKELQHGALIGPFVTSPFQQEVTGISPMSTRPKKNEVYDRRILVDLSWPIDGPSVNAAIPKDTFFGVPVKLRFPTIDLLCQRAYMVGPHALGWRRDMRRVFRQLFLDPISWSYLGIFWLSAIYFNCAAVMGCRSAPYACQSTTNMIRHIMLNLSYIVYNYIDDFMSIDKYNRAWASYNTMGNLLRDLGVCEAEEKATPPSHIVEFLGIIYDLVRMMIIIPEEKMEQIRKLLKIWGKKQVMSKKQLQSVTGKLQFAASCVRPGRVFITRLYDQITVMEDGVQYEVTEQVKKDLTWWNKFMDQHNGTSIMWLIQKSNIDELLATDACLTGIGGKCENNYYYSEIPEDWQPNYCKSIAHFEMLALIIAIKIWAQKITQHKFAVACDNMSVVQIINCGRSKDKLLQDMLRELTYCLVQAQAEMVAHYLPG